MFIAIFKTCVWQGSYDSPTHYSEPVYERKLVARSTKQDLYMRLRSHYRLSPRQIFLAMKEVKNYEMDADVEKFSTSRAQWLWSYEESEY